MADPVGIANFIYTLVTDVYSEYEKRKINIPGCANTLQSYITLVQEIDKKQREKMQESSYVRDQLNKCGELLENLKKLLIEKGHDKENVRSKSGAKLITELKELKDELLKAIPLMENDVISRLIQCKDGIHFWKKNFGDASEVRIEDMTQALAPDFGGEIIPAECYRVFFPAIRDDMVSVRDFAKFTEIVSGNKINCSGMDATFESLEVALSSIMEERNLEFRMSIPYQRAIFNIRSGFEEAIGVPRSDSYRFSQRSGEVAPENRKPIANKWHNKVMHHIKYFHGAVDKSHLPELFKHDDGFGLIEGSYLLRYSSNAENTVAFSFIEEGELKSISIKCRCEDESVEKGQDKTWKTTYV